MKLTESQLDIIDHTMHRTANGLYCGDSADMQVLVGLGLMGSQGFSAFCPDEYFYVTPKGKSIFADSPK